MIHDQSTDRQHDEHGERSFDQPATTQREFMIGAVAADTTLSGVYANADVNEVVPETPDESGTRQRRGR